MIEINPNFAAVKQRLIPLSPQERIKQEKDGLDVIHDIYRYAKSGFASIDANTLKGSSVGGATFGNNNFVANFGPWSDSTGGATRAPQFADYPAGAVFRGTPAAPDFKRNPAAERFGTLLREGARRGPNFAGHLRVVEWSCGASCQSWMIVNTKTGRIQDAPEPAAFGLDFQLTSRLLIVNTFARFKAEDPPWGVPTAKYYVWRNDRFELIHTRATPRSRPQPR